MAGYAVVLGEALVDLLEGDLDGELVYRPAVGGAPLNVAVGIARLGARSEFVGSFGDDAWASRTLEFLTKSGVGTTGAVTIPGVPTALAVTTFRGYEPEFRFYGSSYGLLDPSHIDLPLVAGAGLLYCGSISLLSPPVLAAARRAWAVPGPVRVFDPNIRPVLGMDPAVVAEFAATADLVKLSSADAAALWGPPAPGGALRDASGAVVRDASGGALRDASGGGALRDDLDASPEAAAGRLLDLGAGAVVVTLGASGALVAHRSGMARVSPPAVTAVDATGAGDATMAGLAYQILAGGLPTDLPGWVAATTFAVHVAGLVCESPGGAVSMPTLAEVRSRFVDLAV